MNLPDLGRPGDRRAYPRVTCTLTCAVPGLGEGRVLNVSDGGAFVTLPAATVHPPRQIQVRLGLTDPPIELPAEVVRITTLESGLGLGLQFRGVHDTAGEHIHRFVLARLLAEIAEIMEGDPRPVDPRNIQTISSVESVAASMRQMIEAEGPVPGTLFQRDVGELVDIQLVAADHKVAVVLLRDSGARRPEAGDHIHLTLTRGSYNAHAHTQVLGRSGERVSLEMPASLTVFELRRAPRRAPAPEEMYIAIPVPYPPGTKLRCEVLDISSTGLAFRLPRDAPYFLPGTPLREVAISGHGGDEERRKSAQVMHITPVEDEPGTLSYLRVGIDFGITDENFAKGARPRAGGGEKRSVSFVEKMGMLIGRLVPKRAPQTAAIAASAGVEVIRIPNKRREDIVALLNTTPRGGRRMLAPVIVIPPAHGKRKESTSVLAQILVESFARARRDVVVLRFDGVRNIGESYKDPDCREPGREAMRSTLSQAVDDITTVIEYCHNNPLFSPSELVLCCFSLQGVPGRRATFLDQGKRINYFIGVNGAVAAQEMIRNAAGGVDYIAQRAGGKHIGTAAILGINIDGDPYADDLIRNGLAFMGDAKREIAAIPIPVTWFLGRHDAWIDPATIREFMGVPATAPRELIELDIGHLPLTSFEALTLFSEIVRCIGRQLFSEELEPAIPDPRELTRVRHAEWRRVPKSPLPDRRSYWHSYLLGDSEHKVGYDVLNAADEYLGFLDREAELLDLKPEHIAADMGCGTGNFAARLLRRRGHKARAVCSRLALIDFVPDALEEAERKLHVLGRERELIVPAVSRHLVNLDISPIRTLRRFVTGELFGYDALKGILRGLSDYSIETWRAHEDWRLHDIVRGRELDKQDLAYVRANFPADEQEIILDTNRLTRWLRGRWSVDDLTREGRARVDRGEPLTAADLRLSRLSLQASDMVERLPFADASLDRISCSLVLSYLNNPLELLREFHRVLRPGGRLVVSSMLPDFDMSRIYQRVLRRIESDPTLPLPPGMDRPTFASEMRAFLNHAAFLMMLTEEGQFSFFSRDEMCSLVERAGFRRVENHLAFGEPPQAHITVGHR